MNIASYCKLHLSFALVVTSVLLLPQEAQAYLDVSQGEIDSLPTQAHQLVANAGERSITIPITPPSQQSQPNLTETLFPRLSLADILVIEPNLDPQKARPSYTYTPPQATIATPVTPQAGYKVMVAASSSAQEEKVRTLMPQAFRTVHNGQRVLQVGLFRDRANAEEIRENLRSEGVNTILVQL